MKRASRDPEPAKRWLAFLRNHREAIAAMGFFTVPTITFGVLYCFSSSATAVDASLHFNVTKHPTSCGSCNGCEKRFRLSWLLGFSSSTAMRSTGWTFLWPFDPSS
jgi:hypothetical protein